MGGCPVWCRMFGSISSLFLPIRRQCHFSAQVWPKKKREKKKKSPDIISFGGRSGQIIYVESHNFKIRGLGTWPFRGQGTSLWVQFSADGVFHFFREHCILPVLPVPWPTQGLGKVTSSYTEGPQLAMIHSTYEISTFRWCPSNRHSVEMSKARLCCSVGQVY